MSRTYAQTVAGVAMAMSYDPINKDFSLQYYTTAACSSNTTEVCVFVPLLFDIDVYYAHTHTHTWQIFLNEKLHYSGGYSVSVSPSDKVEWTSPNVNYITVTHDPSLVEGTVITVELSKKDKQL